jgi:hypothetical protein
MLNYISQKFFPNVIWFIDVLYDVIRRVYKHFFFYAVHIMQSTVLTDWMGNNLKRVTIMCIFNFECLRTWLNVIMIKLSSQNYMIWSELIVGKNIRSPCPALCVHFCFCSVPLRVVYGRILLDSAFFTVLLAFFICVLILLIPIKKHKKSYHLLHIHQSNNVWTFDCVCT